MAKESLASVTRRRLLGVGYIVLIGALLWLSIAIYQKKFTSVVLVTLRTDYTGNALHADGNIQYANYLNNDQFRGYMASAQVPHAVYDSWLKVS